jgi:DNA-binding LacI/PurR family transcriptional regulator
VRRHFRPAARTTAIICFNDALALAMLKVLSGLRLEVPGAISVIGFNDLFAQFAIPALTTVSHRFFDIGACAVDLAFALANAQAPKIPQRVLLPSRLVVRDSTGPRRSGS